MQAKNNQLDLFSKEENKESKKKSLEETFVETCKQYSYWRNRYHKEFYRLQESEKND
jgi:hypothetical protein